jgi:hypothetical protein
LEVVKRFLVRQVKNCKAQSQFCVLSAQEVVRAGTEIKQMTRRYARGIVIVLRGAVCRNAYAQRTAIC